MKLAPLSPAQKLDWLQLSRSENIGPRNFQMLLSRFGSAATALKALPELMRAGRLTNVKLAQREDIQREVDEIIQQNFQLVASCEQEYPPALREIDSPPPLITVRGKLSALQMPCVSLVGSRNASAAGLLFTERLAHGLGEAGYCVTSGLARGIDAKAHRAALQTGTIAVLAGGQNRLYPSDHTRLAEEICENGALISEMPLNWEPRAADFPRRNRLVAGIALGTVIIEAALRSGSLITARLANEQGRQVFAVPGSPLDPRAEGTNNLLREGATLCARIEDVTEALNPMRGLSLRPRDLFRETSQPFIGIDEENDATPTEITNSDDIIARVSALLGASPVSIDDLIRQSSLNAGEVQLALFELDVAGRLQRHANGFVSIL